MEIEVSRSRQEYLVTSLILLSLLALTVLGFIGYIVTPHTTNGSAAILTWEEWQLTKARFAYQTEKSGMQKDVYRLRSALDNPADPVRTQIQVERMLQDHQSGLSALSVERILLNRAIQAVGDWSIGAAPFEQADQAVQAAEDILTDSPELQSPVYQIFLPRVAR